MSRVLRSTRVEPLLPIRLDVLVDRFGEAQVAVEVARGWVVWCRAEREILNLLPLQDLLAGRRVVGVLGNLLHECLGLPLIDPAPLPEEPDQIVRVEEIVADDGHGQAAVVTDVFALGLRVQQGGHHRTLSQLAHTAYSS
jgi:hypothetical protein